MRTPAAYEVGAAPAGSRSARSAAPCIRSSSTSAAGSGDGEREDSTGNRG
jgi:hypothetical protein